MSWLVVRLAAVGVAACVVSAPAPTAWCEPAAAAAPANEAASLGLEMAHLVFKDIDAKSLVEGHMGDEFQHMFDSVPSRPKWPGFMRDAALEAADAIRPTLEGEAGRAFSHAFTLEELRIGVAFLRGPAGAELRQGIAEEAKGGSHAPPSPATERELRRMARDPAGRSWFEKFGHLDKILDPVTSEVVASFVLETFGRFTDKARADESTRQAAP